MESSRLSDVIHSSSPVIHQHDTLDLSSPNTTHEDSSNSANSNQHHKLLEKIATLQLTVDTLKRDKVVVDHQSQKTESDGLIGRKEEPQDNNNEMKKIEEKVSTS